MAGKGFTVMRNSSQTATPTLLVPRSIASKRPVESNRDRAEASSVFGFTKSVCLQREGRIGHRRSQICNARILRVVHGRDTLGTLSN
jgi:hypothetical protein